MVAILDLGKLGKSNGTRNTECGTGCRRFCASPAKLARITMSRQIFYWVSQCNHHPTGCHCTNNNCTLFSCRENLWETKRVSIHNNFRPLMTRLRRRPHWLPRCTVSTTPDPWVLHHRRLYVDRVYDFIISPGSGPPEGAFISSAYATVFVFDVLTPYLTRF